MCTICRYTAAILQQNIETGNLTLQKRALCNLNTLLGKLLFMHYSHLLCPLQLGLQRHWLSQVSQVTTLVVHQLSSSTHWLGKQALEAVWEICLVQVHLWFVCLPAKGELAILLLQLLVLLDHLLHAATPPQASAGANASTQLSRTFNHSQVRCLPELESVLIFSKGLCTV